MAVIPSSFPRALSAVAAAAVLLGLSACAQQLSVENADVPAWKATALPSASGVVAEDSGKILNAQPIDHTENVPAGTYTLTLVCEGGGKAFLAVRSGGKELADLGAACYGTPESRKITLPESGPLELSASSVDAPLIYAYQLVTAG
ncbi:MULTISPECIES: hypothetical protein [unclassified Pseudarthrobacter]|uniref:hypothetical protein n=1 Tax=unclassified Pseudarthrobacter TaxID=2647000 RepID=UPI0011313BAA|nr:hypothetical protein [Pseudarthrobacter sp. NIBRBAC000502772]QDG68265.1 hypothetical protein NIBR502772_20465 [Pseudarthrobacter sp. NIBRBAC000502772]